MPNQLMTNSAPTFPPDRIYVHENFSLTAYSYSSIDELIVQLTELRAEGYTRVDIEARLDADGGAELDFNAVRRRLENDEEYGNRTRLVETYRQRRYQEYLRMREEFGDTGPFEPA